MHLASLLSASQCSLTRLSITLPATSHTSDGEILQILELTPELVSLQLLGSSSSWLSDVFVGRLHDTTTANFLPKLKTFGFYCDPFKSNKTLDMTALVDALESRILSGGGLGLKRAHIFYTAKSESDIAQLHEITPCSRLRQLRDLARYTILPQQQGPAQLTLSEAISQHGCQLQNIRTRVKTREDVCSQD